MSRPTRFNPEGYTAGPSEAAWGCVSPSGWVPYPRKIPRRHALLDTVGRMDDPCARPVYNAPDWNPSPAYKPPREGYPNDMCNVDESRGQASSYDSQIPEGAAVINVGQNTPQSIRVKIPAALNNSTGCEDQPTLEECCNETRSLDVVKEKYEEIVGPLEEREAGHDGKFSKCMTKCQPLLPKYPCRGIIDERPEEWKPIPKEEQCKAKSLRSGGEELGDWQSKKNLNGWEFIEKCKTCDYYPIDAKLPSRFNHPAWFQGYGCERPIHPFYVTTTSDYGRFGPNPHTMTQMYHPRSSEFTSLLGITGMYRNRTLNTSNNKTVV